MDITTRLNALGYEKSGSFCKGHITGHVPFGVNGGYTIFVVLLDTPQGSEVATKRTYPNGKDLNSWSNNLTVDEMQLALEIIYCYREWKQECPTCMSFDNEDFVCTSSMKGE